MNSKILNTDFSLKWKPFNDQAYYELEIGETEFGKIWKNALTI